MGTGPQKFYRNRRVGMGPQKFYRNRCVGVGVGPQKFYRNRCVDVGLPRFYRNRRMGIWLPSPLGATLDMVSTFYSVGYKYITRPRNRRLHPAHSAHTSHLLDFTMGKAGRGRGCPGATPV